MDTPQILRWKILNDKLNKSEKLDGFFLGYLCDGEERLLEKELGGNDDGRLSVIENFFCVYEEMIKTGEIELPENKNDLIECRVFQNKQFSYDFEIPSEQLNNYNDPNFYEFFCFKPNVKLIKRVFNETVEKWRFNTGKNHKSYDIQRKLMMDYIRGIEDDVGAKDCHLLDTYYFKGELDFFDCIFALEKSREVKILNIDFTNHVIDEKLQYILDGEKIVFDEKRSRLIYGDKTCGIPIKGRSGDATYQYEFCKIFFPSKGRIVSRCWDSVFEEIMKSEPPTYDKKVKKIKKSFKDTVKAINKKTLNPQSGFGLAVLKYENNTIKSLF